MNGYYVKLFTRLLSFGLLLLTIFSSSWFSLGNSSSHLAFAHTDSQEPVLERWQAAQATLLTRPEGNASFNLASKTLSIAADTELRQADPNTNWGNELSVDLGFPDSQRRQMLLDVYLWELPPHVTINQAVLKFAVAGWYDYLGQSRTITAYRVTSLWNEGLATWNHAPATAEVVGSVVVGTPQEITWYSIDITQLAQAWYSGSFPNYGVMLVGPEGGEPVYRTIASGETTYYPRLEVTYTTTPPTLGNLKTVNFLVADTATHSQAIHLINTGSEPFDWQANVGGVSWLSLSQTSGTVAPNAVQVIQVNANATGLGLGTFNTQLQFTSATVGALGFPQQVNVTLSYVDTLHTIYSPLALRQYTHSGGPTRKVVGLFIGIADYQYMSPPPMVAASRAGSVGYDLMFAANDPLRTGAVFSALGGFASADEAQQNIKVLTEGQATYAEIERAFNWLAEQEDENTIVFVFYSGHGGRVPDDNGDESDGWDEFITAYDTHDSGGTYSNIIRDDTLDAWLAKLDSTQVVVALDSCFSGGMASLLTDGNSKGLSTPASTDIALSMLDGLLQDLNRPGRVILTASTATQESWESGMLNHGVFSYYLIMALMDPAADTDQNGWVSAQEAFAYAAPKVDAYVFQNMGVHQTPQLYDQTSGRIELTRP